MPIYEYRCPKGHTFEVFHGMSDPSPATCDVCGASPVQIVLHPVAVHFKGSGFYTTDYGRGSRKRDAKEGDAASSAAASSTDGTGGGDSKTETKAAEAS